MTPPLLSIAGEVVDGVCVLTVVGDVDLATADQLRDALRRSAAGGHPIVVDLAGVRFLDAAGVSALVAGGRPRLIGATGIVLRILTITGLLAEP